MLCSLGSLSPPLLVVHRKWTVIGPDDTEMTASYVVASGCGGHGRVYVPFTADTVAVTVGAAGRPESPVVAPEPLEAVVPLAGGWKTVQTGFPTGTWLSVTPRSRRTSSRADIA